MKIAVYSRDGGALTDERLSAMFGRLRGKSFDFFEVSGDDVSLSSSDADMMISVGGDGTFLSASQCVGRSGIPILGVNLGRVGFLSEYSPEEAGAALLSGDWYLEDRALLNTGLPAGAAVPGFRPYTLNEVSVHRSGAALMGIDVSIDGHHLPTYWADGLLVATSSGSTAYSLSVGGPICSPEARVLIIAPIAPHNLNVRPLVVPDSTAISVSMRSRDDKVMLSMDNRNHLVDPSLALEVKVAQFSLKRVRLNNSSFIKALTTKLFWGEDIRNSGE